ncbi:CARDB domain-containing protein [Natronomonas salsuginis]|uniref:PGF-CTERM sorting domain-containing protein n=1 Tax=Natronomonas salsuginis TaxID=2217661 RepID=A0A4U5JBV8_9EURY|nr:CARDB domain-containing protein [Natronomonas salsuginis]TKR25318.1 PGF-CTERM sorting domain-containing protein [Natronomonas salsuginis]
MRRQTTDTDVRAGKLRAVLIVSAVALSILFGGVAFVGSASAQTNNADIVVDEDWSEPDAVPDGYDDATNSINEAVGLAGSGDTIHVKSGTYDESVIVDVSNLMVKSVGSAEETVITRSVNDGTPTVAIDADGVVLDGFTIERGGASTTTAQGVRVAASDVEVRNNHVEHTNDDDQTDNGVLVTDRDSNGDPVSSNVSDVLIRNNTISGFPVGAAVATQEDNDNTVRELDISNNELSSNGVGVGFSQAVGATDLGDGLSTDGNTFDGNGYGVYIFGDDDSKSYLTLNNTRTDGISIENNDFLNPNSKLAGDGNDPLHIVNNGNEEGEDAPGPVPDTIVEDNGEFDGAVRYDDDVVAPEIQPVIDEFVENEGEEEDEPEEETIVVAPGTYDGATIDESLVTLEGPNAGLDGASEDRGPEATIQGKLQVKADGVTVRGVTVSPTSTFTADSSLPLAGIFVNGNNVSIENNSVSGINGDAATGESSVTINGVQVFKQDSERLNNITISNNLIENIDNSGGEAWPNYGGAVGIKIQNQLDDVHVNGNTIRRIHSAGWTYGIVSTPSSKNSVQPTNVVVEGNRIESIGNGDQYDVFADDTAAPYAGAAVGLDTASGDSEEDPVADAAALTVTENSIFDTPIGAHNKDLGATLTATNNYWDSPTGPDGDGSRTIGDVETDPWYLNEDRETLSNELGDTIVVDADGDGDVTDIQTALDLIEVTDAEINTIEIQSGIYEGSPTIDLPGLTVQAAEGADPEIQGIVTIAAPGVTVDGLTIDGGDENAAPLDVQAGSPTITNNTIRGGSDAGGISTWGGPGPVDGTVLIEGNAIENGPIGLVVDGDSTVDIRGNDIDGATSEAIWLSDFTDSASISEADITIDNNDIGSVALADIKIETTAPASLNGNSELGDPSDVAVQFLEGSNAETVTLWNGQTYDENGNVVVQEGDSIQDVIDNAGEDATIVLDGEFEEDVTVDQPGLTIEGTDDATVVGQSTGYGGALEIAADDVSVSGLTIEGTGEAAVYVRSGTKGFHLTDSTIRTATSPDGRPNGLLFETGGTDDHHIEGNIFENEADSSENPILAYVNGGVSGPTESTNVSFVDNTFTGDSVGGGIALGHEATDSEITENTFEVGADYGQLEVWVSGVEVTDNEFEADELGPGAFHIRDDVDNVDANVLNSNDFERAVFVDETTDGSQKVFAGLGAAVDDAVQDATVTTSTGSFEGGVTVDTDLTIKGPNAGVAGPERVTSDLSDEAVIQSPDSDAIRVSNNPDITIDGLAFDGNQRFLSVDDGWGDITIRNSVFTNAQSKTGGHFWFTGDAGMLTFERNYIGNNAPSNGLRVRVDSGGPANVDISDNHWENNNAWAMNLNQVEGVIEDNVFENTQDTEKLSFPNGQGGVLLADANNDLAVTDNEFESLTASGLNLYGNFDGELEVTTNDFESTSNVAAIQISDRQLPEGGFPADPENIVIVDNNFENNEQAISNQVDKTLVATENYWGADTGPGGEGPGDGDAVSENVQFEPFLDAPFDEGGEPIRPTAFEVTNFEISAEEVPVGEQITAELTVENTGDVAGVKPISIRAGDETIETFGVEGGVALGSGATFTDEVTFAPGSQGQLTIAAEATDDTTSEIITVTEAETTFDVGETEIDSDEALPGDEVTVTATVTNSGTVEGTRTVDLERDDETVDSVDVTLDAEESTTVELSDIPSVSLENNEVTYTVATPTDNRGAGAIEILESATVDITGENLGALSPVVAGETTTVAATVTNNGDVATTETVALTADGSTIAETDAEVTGGESTDIELQADTQALSAGTYDLMLATSDDTASGTLNVDAPAEFVPTVESVSDPAVGADIEVETTIRNVGDASASGEVELIVPGVGNETVETGEIAGDESETVTLTVATDEDAIGEQSLFVTTDDETVDNETTVLAPPELDVAIEGATDPLVAEQDTLAVEVAVENDGGVEAENVAVDLALSGEEEASETVSVAGGESETVTFDEIDVGEALEGDLELNTTATYDGTTVDDTETVSVLEAPEDALFRVSDFTVTDNTPRDDVLRTESGTVNVEATIENVGELEGTQEVPLLVDGESVTSENSLTLGGGESTTNEFTIDANELRPGDRRISAQTEDSDRSSTVSVRDPTQATFEVEVDESNLPLERGDTVEATVQNVGDLQGTQSVSLEIRSGGETLETSTEDVTLGLDETATVDVTVPDVPRAGTTDVTVDVEAADASDSVETTIDFGSIGDGLAAAESGDTVHVAPGDYDEAVTLDESDVTLSGEDATFTSGSTAVSITANGVTVEGFNFERADVGVEITGDDATVRSTRFLDSVTNGTEIRAVNATIENSRFDNLTDTAVVLTGGADETTIVENNILDNRLGIYADAGFHVVEDNNIERNSYAAIDADRPFADSITEIDATDNYWGRPGGPITEGPNAEILSPVTTEPFLTEPNEDPDYRIADSNLSGIAEAAEGEPVEVTYTVENVGGTAGSDSADTLVLSLDGETVAETDAFEIGAGQTLSNDDSELDALTFEVDAATAARLDSGQLELSTDDDTDSKAVDVLSAPDFEAAITDVPDELETDETLTVEATIENGGQTAGTKSVRLQFDGTTVDTEELTVAGGSASKVTLSTELDGSDVGTNLLVDVLPTDGRPETVTVLEASDPAPVGNIGGGGSSSDVDTETPQPDDGDPEPAETPQPDEPVETPDAPDETPQPDEPAEPTEPQPDPTETPIDEPAELPGFGVVVTLVALLAAALLARVRR